MLTYEKLSSPLDLFGLKSFHGFVILGGRLLSFNRCLPWVLFGHKNVGKYLQKKHIEHDKQQ